MEILLLANFTTISSTTAPGMVIVVKIITNVSENSSSK